MTSDRDSSVIGTLIVRVHTIYCAISLTDVIETMRPLPIERVAGMPEFVQGVSLIRGIATPVVGLGAFLGMPNRESNRFVTIRVDDRQLALGADEVIGIQQINPTTLQDLPPLLHSAAQDLIEAVGRLDAQLLIVLRSGWILPEAVFQDLPAWKVAI